MTPSRSRDLMRAAAFGMPLVLAAALAGAPSPLHAQAASPSGPGNAASSGSGDSTPGNAGPAVPVAVSPAQRGPVPLEITANGNVVAEATVTVRSRVDGQIEKVHAQEGQRVERGQVLFTLDSRMAQAQLAQQEAQLARDRALAVRARADATRYTSLRGEGFAAAQRYEQAQADAASAEANLRGTEALIAQTRLTLDYATIRAEITGRLGALPITEGNLVRAGEQTALATITQTDPIQVQFSVPERWLPEIRAAMQRGEASGALPRVTAHPPGDSHPPVQGQLFFVDSQVDTTSGTVQLKARFPNADSALWPGQYVNVVLVPRTEPDALSVPVQAVQTGSGGERYVYVVDGQSRARRRAVTLQRVVGGRAVLRAEIAAGDKVVTEGAQLLTDGARVAERPGQPTPARPRAEEAPRCTCRSSASAAP
ncbi:efflux RND transporter periplasmic adaptor subunit [Pseudoroseomonas cervicalis]|uniref:efflux RND transporter periplasmic adaptor subunit n=1 Tax=Teichococcus cervicalis TaxID=204525 RepID=UPI0022F1A1D3|nr:efflux RND transporter periplasmic adaptor subunit [Pseudoroseomonas cervicalis]WBV42251.1 efflux RND transporter periplasmic adaptor subunit [Pseudoroseomonas cervicalis]